MFHLRFIGLAVSLLAQSLIVLSVSSQAQAQTQTGAQDEASGFQAEADAIAARWTETLNSRFRELAALDEQAFITGWAEEIDGWKTQLRALEVEHDRSAEAYITRIHYEWATGRLFYGPMHGRLTQDRAFRPSSTYDAYLDEVDLGRADLLELDEYRSFIERLRDYWADTRFDEDVPGTVQFLTTKLESGNRFSHPDIQCYLNTQSLRLWGRLHLCRQINKLFRVFDPLFDIHKNPADDRGNNGLVKADTRREGNRDHPRIVECSTKTLRIELHRITVQICTGFEE